MRYRGKKSIPGLLSFLKRHTLPLITRIPPKKLDFFRKIDDVVVVAFLPSTSSSHPSSYVDEQLNRFRGLAEKRRFEFVFGYISDAEDVAKKEGVEVPGIKVFRNRDGDDWVKNGGFGGEEDLEELLEGVEENFIKEFKEREEGRYMVVSLISDSMFTLFLYHL